MADIYSPWMAGSEEDVTTMGLATPEYMEMYAEAQAGPGSEASVEMETEPEMEDSSGEAGAVSTDGEGSGMHSAMQMALKTINQQSLVMQSLMEQLKG